jgi:hypothetical protein
MYPENSIVVQVFFQFFCLQ